MASTKALKIKQIRSSSKLKPNQALTLRALGLRGIGSEIFRTDLRAVRGMLNRLQHIVTAEQVNGPVKKETKIRKGQAGIRIGK
jgi:large subunit ribosomal protein L30